MMIHKSKVDILYSIKSWIGKILLISCACELLFFYSPENLYGCLTLLYGWFLISTFCIKREYLNKYLLPTLVMFGLGFCYSFLPIVVTLLEDKPLTFNFQVPYLTFTNQIISVSIITLSYRLAIRVYKPRNLLNKLWNKIGYMSVPTEKVIWIMGFIGLAALLSIMAGQGMEKEDQATGNAVSIIINAFSVFSLAPISLYFKHLYGDNSSAKSKRFVKYYIFVLILLGIATTRRALILNSTITIACIYIFLLIYNNRRVVTAKNTLIICAVGYLVTGPLADLAAAMILNRQLVKSESASATFDKVWQLYQDKETLHTMYQIFMESHDNGGDNQQGWSEYYVDNIFLDRFCNLRTIDATLYNAQKCGLGSLEGRKYYENFWINELPSPIANALGLKKDFFGTATDHMVISNFGNIYTLKGFKVGGETGIGLWMFGYWYYVIALMTYFVMFYFLCSFVNTFGGRLTIPIPILINFRLYWMFFLNANGIFTSMNNVFMRNNLHKILIYCVMIFILNQISLIKKK